MFLLTEASSTLTSDTTEDNNEVVKDEADGSFTKCEFPVWLLCVCNPEKEQQRIFS